MAKTTKTLKIYLFRHGQTAYNRDGRFTGLHDPSLTKLGIQQAKKLARKLKNKKFEAAIFTHLKRSKQTLDEVLKSHPECAILIEDNRMMERNYGDLNGTLHSEFIKKIGKKLCNLEVQGDLITSLPANERKKVEKSLGEEEFKLIHRGFYVPPPNGESFAMVEKRVKSFIYALIRFMKRHNMNVAISAHGNSIRLFRKIMKKASIEETVSWQIPYDKYFEYSVRV